jgi:hypothetical protein
MNPPEEWTLLLPFRETAANGAAPLRVGVILDRGQPAPWVDALHSFLKRLPGVDVGLVTLIGRPPAVSKRPPRLTERLYAASRARFDPFGDIVLDAKEPATIQSLDTIRAAGFGLLIWLAECKDPGMTLDGIAEHGVFSVRLGEGTQLIPFWDEVANGRVTSTVSVFWPNLRPPTDAWFESWKPPVSSGSSTPCRHVLKSLPVAAGVGTPN